jgi:hypothetical protein
MSKELAENEVFDLRRQIDRLLQVPGSEGKIARLQVQISQLQQSHGAMSGVKHEEGKVEIESLENLIVEDRAIPDMCAEVTATTVKAFNLLLARRDAAYLSAISGLETERIKLEGESVSLRESERTLGEVGPARMRQAQFEADALLVAGRVEESHRKIAEAQQAEAEPARTKARQKEINERLEAIEAEKKEALRSAAVDFRESSIQLIRASESGLALILDGVRDNLNTLEMQVGASLYQPAQLTADEKSPAWVTLNRLYAGRTR